jgi:hypothetical protein
MTGNKPAGKHLEKRLSAAKIRSQMEPGFYGDGNGLYLKVDPSGAKRWIQRIVIQGKRRDIGLGSTTLVSLAEAREAALPRSFPHSFAQIVAGAIPKDAAVNNLHTAVVVPDHLEGLIVDADLLASNFLGAGMARGWERHKTKGRASRQKSLQMQGDSLSETKSSFTRFLCKTQ